MGEYLTRFSPSFLCLLAIFGVPQLLEASPRSLPSSLHVDLPVHMSVSVIKFSFVIKIPAIMG